jgi:hypothetical protein
VFFSERSVGDQNKSQYTPSRDVVLAVGGNLLLPDDAAQACQLTLPAVTRHASYAGASWLFGGYAHTCYNHVLTPNSRTPDCAAGGEVSANGPGAFTARSVHSGGVFVLLGDGSARFVSESINQDVWRALSTIDSGETVHDF